MSLQRCIESGACEDCDQDCASCFIKGYCIYEKYEEEHNND